MILHLGKLCERAAVIHIPARMVGSDVQRCDTQQYHRGGHWLRADGAFGFITFAERIYDRLLQRHRLPFDPYRLRCSHIQLLTHHVTWYSYTARFPGGSGSPDTSRMAVATLQGGGGEHASC